MAKKIIKLTENDLANIINECVKSVISEGSDDNTNYYDIDITDIDIDVLRSAYRDLRLTPTSVAYDGVLHEPQQIKEAFGDIVEPDEAIKDLLKKYGLPQQFARKIEHHHKIYIYVIVAKIGENEKIIEEDMIKMGYFLSKTLGVVTVNGMSFQKLQFEPNSQLQDDITDEVKSKYDFLYHWTPMYCVEGIKQRGLIPSHKNELFNYPPRTYFMAGDSDERNMLGLGQKLCTSNNNPKNNGRYALMAVGTKNLEEKIRFYYDTNSAIGIYTEQTIPQNNIQMMHTVQFVKSLKQP